MLIQSIMSGIVWKLKVKIGDRVEEGQEVAILESMKMEIPIVSEKSGVITDVYKNEGDFIEEGEAIVKLGA